MADCPSPRRVRRLLAALAGDRRAATAVEYGLILALIVLGVMTALIGLGGQTQNTWGNLHDRVKSVTPN